MNICQVLIEKLSKDELRELCVAYDDGKLDIILEQYLLPKNTDKAVHPIVVSPSSVFVMYTLPKNTENFPKGDRK